MIAEIHGKISRTASNLSERLEDKLTGNVFGNLRYLSYDKGLKPILENIIIYKGNTKQISESICNIREPFIGDKIEFWPFCKVTKTELDLSVNLEDLFIGIEVKYKSPLGQDQLLRELLTINYKRNRKKGLLLFIAQSNGLAEAIQAIDELVEEHYLFDDISFAYITWEDIYEIYNNSSLNYYNDYEKVIIQDIKKLLRFKGFEKYNDFKLGKDYEIKNIFFEFHYDLIQDFNFKFDTKIEEEFYGFR